MAHNGYSGQLPTIADSRRLGMTGFRVECSTRYCHHEKRVEFERKEGETTCKQANPKS
jgi:hypothetical protein